MCVSVWSISECVSLCLHVPLYVCLCGFVCLWMPCVFVYVLSVCGVFCVCVCMCIVYTSLYLWGGLCASDIGASQCTISVCMCAQVCCLCLYCGLCGGGCVCMHMCYLYAHSLCVWYVCPYVCVSACLRAHGCGMSSSAEVSESLASFRDL